MTVEYFRSQSIRGFQFPKEKLHGSGSINWAAVYAVCYNEGLHKDIYVVLPDVVRRPLDVGTLIDYVLFDVDDSRGWYLRESMPDNSRVYDEPEDVPNDKLLPFVANVTDKHVHQMMTTEKVEEIIGSIGNTVDNATKADMKLKMTQITTGPVK